MCPLPMLLSTHGSSPLLEGGTHRQGEHTFDRQMHRLLRTMGVAGKKQGLPTGPPNIPTLVEGPCWDAVQKTSVLEDK